MEKREKFVDIARGISILLMIIGHNIDGGMLRTFIYSFHMPLFIIVSGMFYKDKTLKNFLHDTIVKLFMPYMFCLLITDFCLFFKEASFLNIINEWLKQLIYSLSYVYKFKFSNVFLTGVLWFIPFLIAIKSIFYIVKKLFKNNKLYEYITCSFLTIVGIGLGSLGYYLPFSLDVALACMFFYYIGYVSYSTNVLREVLNNKNIIIYMSIIWIIGIINGNIEIAVRSYPNLVAYLAAICGSLVVLKFCNFLETKKFFFNNFFEWCGKNSLYILLIHHIEKELLNFEFLNTKVEYMFIIEIIVRISLDIISVYVLDKICKSIYIKYLKKNRNKFDVKEKEIEKVSCD